MQKMTRLASYAGIVFALVATPAHAQSGPPTFYNLADDANSLELLELDSVAGSGAKTSAVVINLFRGTQKLGLINTWQFNCVRHTQQIVRTETFAPGTHGPDLAVKSEVVNSNATPTSRTLSAMVCTGGGNLSPNRTNYAQLSDIIQSFWGR